MKIPGNQSYTFGVSGQFPTFPEIQFAERKRMDTQTNTSENVTSSANTGGKNLDLAVTDYRQRNGN